MLDRIIEIICDQACLEAGETNITSNTNIREDLDIDSLDIVEIIMIIEDEFNVEISDEIIETLNTLGDLVDYIISQK